MGNQNSGRRPKPEALRLLRGEPARGRRFGDGVKPPPGEVVKPEGMSAAASRVWETLAPICLAMKTLTPADVNPFRALCELQATFEETTALKDGGYLVRMLPGKEDGEVKIVVDALLKLERETAIAMLKYYELFGMTPVARARMVMAKPEADTSKWAGVMK